MRNYILSLALIPVIILTGCGAARQPQEVNPSKLNKVYEQEFCQKFIPDAYHPVDFEIQVEENDLEKKRIELSKLREHDLISEQELEEKLKFFDLNF